MMLTGSTVNGGLSFVKNRQHRQKPRPGVALGVSYGFPAGVVVITSTRLLASRLHPSLQSDAVYQRLLGLV